MPYKPIPAHPLYPNQNRVFSYGPDGRRLNANGEALEPISPGRYWNDVFMRTFIRRLVPNNEGTANSLSRKESEAPNAFFMASNQHSQHIDIVDLSPSSSTSSAFPLSSLSSFYSGPSLSKDLKNEAEDGTGETKRSCNNTASSTRSSSSSVSSGNLTPDRPSPEVSSTDEEEAEGDALARVGSTTRMPNRAQRMSAKAIRAMLEPCCAFNKQMVEFARLDLSHLNLFGKASKCGSKGARSNMEVDSEGLVASELIADSKGSRIWTTNSLAKIGRTAKKHHRVAFTTEHEKQELTKSNNGNSIAAVPFIQFHISSVRIEPAKEVQIQLETMHNCMPYKTPFKVDCCRL